MLVVTTLTAITPHPLGKGEDQSKKLLLIDLGRKDLIWGERRGRFSEEEWQA
jgi:hypothetical protein